MLELLVSKAIFSWLLALVGVRLGLWFAQSFSPKREAGRTLKEALVVPATGNLKLAVIAAFAAVTFYFLDASEAIATLFAALPELFPLPKGFLYDLAVVIFGIALVVEAVELQSYKHDLADAKSKNWLYAAIAARAFLYLSLIVLLTLDHQHRFLSEYVGVSSNLSDGPAFLQYLYLNPGFVPLLAFATLANLVHNHRHTLLAQQGVNKAIQTIAIVVIVGITLSLIALQVLSATAALVALASVAFIEWDKMRWLEKKMA